MNLKRFFCALMCAVLIVCAPVTLAEEDKDARIAELEAQVAELEAQVAAYHLKEIVASFDGGEVSVEEAEAQYEYMVSIYAQYGIDVAAYGLEDSVRQEVVATLAENAIVLHMAEQLGLGLTEDQETQFATEATQGYESTVEMYYQSYFADQYEDESEGRTAAAQYLNEQGYTYESTLKSLRETQLATNVYDYITADVTVTEEEVKAAYDEYVAADQSTYEASAYQFESAYTNGSDIYYTPEGYRVVKHILFQFDDEQAAQYEELCAQLDALDAELAEATATDETATDAAATDETAADETAAAETAADETATEEAAPRAAEEIEADIAEAQAQLDALYQQLIPEAEAAAARFESGEDIEALIAELNDDTGMPETGYAVSETADASTQMWDPAFTEGALSIEEVGGLSEPVLGTYGVHLIYYAGDLTPGATPYEDVRANVETLALSEKVNQTYADQIAAWEEELNLQLYPENIG